MPYISKLDRPRLDAGNPAQSAGELNYVISTTVDRYIVSKGLNYTTLNEAIGVLECAKLELYRRIVAKYEEGKIANPENGDVFTAGN